MTEPIVQVAALQPHQQHLLENLSPRQQDIMRLVHRGWTNKMIARELGVAEGTVKVHLSVIFRALGVHNRSAAIAVINGWLEAGQDTLGRATTVALRAVAFAPAATASPACAASAPA